MLPRRQAAAGTQKAEEKLRRAYETRNECQRAAQGGVYECNIWQSSWSFISQIGNACMYWHYEHQPCNSTSFHRPWDLFATDSRRTQPLRPLCLCPVLRHECIIPGQKTVAAGLKWWFLLQVHLHVGWLPTHQIQDRYSTFFFWLFSACSSD